MKPPIDYESPMHRQREPPQWWVLLLIAGLLMVAMIWGFRFGGR